MRCDRSLPVHSIGLAGESNHTSASSLDTVEGKIACSVLVLVVLWF